MRLTEHYSSSLWSFTTKEADNGAKKRKRTVGHILKVQSEGERSVNQDGHHGSLAANVSVFSHE